MKLDRTIVNMAKVAYKVAVTVFSLYSSLTLSKLKAIFLKACTQTIIPMIMHKKRTLLNPITLYAFDKVHKPRPVPINPPGKLRLCLIIPPKMTLILL